MANRKPKSVPLRKPVKGRSAAAKVIDANQPDGEQREECRKAAVSLMRSFDWCETIEGDAFWQSVCDRLFEIANGATLK